MIFAETLGLILSLLAVVSLFGALTRAFITQVWQDSAKGNVVDTTDALIALGMIVFSSLKLLKSHWVATVSTVAVFISLTVWSEISVHASLGYSAVVCAIVGFLTPSLLRRVRPKVDSARDSHLDKAPD